MTARRAICPGCGRSVAVGERLTIRGHSQATYAMRPHNTPLGGGHPCGRRMVHGQDIEVTDD